MVSSKNDDIDGILVTDGGRGGRVVFVERGKGGGLRDAWCRESEPEIAGFCLARELLERERERES